MKWERSLNGLLYLQTAIGPFYIGVNYRGGISFYINPPSRIVWDEEFPTFIAAKRAIEQRVVELSAGISGE